jgi:hypothetical protein
MVGAVSTEKPGACLAKGGIGVAKIMTRPGEQAAHHPSQEVQLTCAGRGLPRLEETEQDVLRRAQAAEDFRQRPARIYSRKLAHVVVQLFQQLAGHGGLSQQGKPVRPMRRRRENLTWRSA